MPDSRELRLTVQLDRADAAYQPGDRLAGRCRLAGGAADELRALELSVVWYTLGQGDEDMAVHMFQRWEHEGPDRLPDVPADPPIDTRAFSCVLPRSPLSYDGLLIKIGWCVRARAFLGRGRELVAEAPFQLGSVPPARMALPSPDVPFA